MSARTKQQNKKIPASPEGGPKLRFPEFSGEWEEKRLGEVCEINPNTENLPDKFIYIDLESVEKGVLKQEKIVLKSEAPSRAQRLLKKSDILFQMVRPYQQNNLFFDEDGDYVASTGYAQVRTKQNSKFLYQYFHTKSFLNKVLIRCTGTSYPAINSNDFKRIKIFIPPLPEQQKIAGFLSAVDERIGVLQKKREALVKYKKGIMQKIFSQEIRFKNDNGKDFPEWKENKIEDIFEITRGYVLSTKEMNKEETGEYKYPVYSSQTKEDGLIGYYKEYLYENAITWTTDGANAGEVKYRKGKFYCTNVCGVLLNNEGYANQCIAEILNLITRKYVSYVGNPKLMNNTMSKIKIKVPPLPEQQKIANFLSAIDKKIELVDAQIQKMQKWKRGLMQILFI